MPRASIASHPEEAHLLKGLDRLLTADLLWVLAAMGHGDDLALVDGNHPAERIARATVSGRLIRLPGITVDRVAQVSVLPLDDFVETPVRRMEVVGQPEAIPLVQAAVQAVVDRAAGRSCPMGSIERFAFYEEAERAFAVVQAGDARQYGCFLFKKGVLPAHDERSGDRLGA
jgi:L-fucose mutarotase